MRDICIVIFLAYLYQSAHIKFDLQNKPYLYRITSRCRWKKNEREKTTLKIGLTVDRGLKWDFKKQRKKNVMSMEV